VIRPAPLGASASAGAALSAERDGPARASASVQVLARGVSWVGAGHVVSQIMWFGSLFVMARLVGTSSFGSVTIAMVIIQVAWMLVGAGTTGSFIVSRAVTRNQIWTTLAFNAATGFGVAVVVAVAGGPIIHLLAPGANAAVMRVLALSIALIGVSVVPLALLQKELQFKRHAAANAGAATLSSIIGIVAAVLGAGVWALVARQVLFQGLLAAFAWLWARSVLPARAAGERIGLRHFARPKRAVWFFSLTVINFIAFNIDYVIVGRFTNVARLGLYSLAFTVAFAPVTQFAWQIGKVLFPGAARTDPDAIGARGAKAVTLTAAALFPFIPPAIALAPIVLPGLLGAAWRPMVGPFEILLVAGIAYALLEIMRDVLLGSGSVLFCLRINAVWLLAMAGGLYAGVRLDGIEGASIVHVVLVIPLAVTYLIWGTRRIGSTPSQMWFVLRGVLVPVVAEGLATLLGVAALRAAGAGRVGAAVLGAALGLSVALVLMWRVDPSPLRLARGVVVKARAAA
jgi:O-antigen/teichoic acid export membrane protein